MCNVSCVSCHVSPVTCHLSPVTCQNIFIKNISMKICFFLFCFFYLACWWHGIFQMMWIIAPIILAIFYFRKKIKFNMEWLLIFKVVRVGPQMHQSNTSHVWTIHRCNLEQFLIFKALRVGQRVHESTRQTSPTHGQSMYAMRNNSLFLGLFRVSRRDSSKFSRMDNPIMQSGTTPCF